MTLIRTFEQMLGTMTKKNFLPMQPGDVIVTYAEISRLQRDIGSALSTPLQEGIPRWVAWHKVYMGIR